MNHFQTAILSFNPLTLEYESAKTYFVLFIHSILIHYFSNQLIISQSMQLVTIFYLVVP